MLRPVLAAAVLAATAAPASADAMSPLAMCGHLEARMAAGDGITLPDADAELAHFAGTVDLADGDWPEAFLARAGETVCVAASPFTGCYEFFDEAGAVFWTVVPVLPTTENWVAPFRHAEAGAHPDDALYAPWRLVDVWQLSHAEFAESAEFFDLDFGFVDNGGQLRFANNPAPTNLCFTAFSFTETNLFFTAAWPTNEALPDATLDLYGSTNLSSRWLLLSSYPATNPPVSFVIDPVTLPWHVSPTQHVHDATCESITNVVASPLDGVTVYTNVFWSCSTNRTPGEAGFFRLGTHHDTDGDGLPDAYELLVLGTSTNAVDTDLDGLPDAEEAALGTNPGAVDTDRDGLPDGWEFAAGLDPLDPTGDNGGSGDPDGDGRTNSQERSADTAPLLADTDGDGIPDGTTAYAWNHHSLRPTASAPANLVIDATAFVPSGASAAIRLGTLTVPLTNGTHRLAFHISAGQNYEFRIRCTGGATIAAGIVPPAGNDPPLRDGGEDPPRSDLPGFTLSDPDDAFLGIPLRTALAILSMPAVSLVSADGLGACVHERPGTRSWNVRIRPGSWSDYADRASFEGFSTDGNGTVSLAVADTPRSVTNGTVLVASTDPRFPPATASAEIHRCEYDPATGACPLCGETHVTTGISISVTQDYRYALFGETNMSRFAATVRGGDMDDIVWTVSPALTDGVWLHSSDDPADAGDFEISGVAKVWADSGLITNQFTITAAFPFAPDKSVSKPFTTVAIDAEAICTEVDSSGFVVNPISVPIGETATFRVKVFPSSVPNSDIQWRIVYGADCATFAGSRYGREVNLRGLAAGPVWLEVQIAGYNGPIPQFQTTIMPLYDIPVVAWIVCDNNGNNPATDESRIRTMVDQANYLFRQVCISCYVHQINYTNHEDWLNLGTWGTPVFNAKFDQMTAVSNPVAGIEAHFVDDMVKAVGVNSTNGMALSDRADFHTFAHEVGHAMRLADIYSWHPDTTLTVTGDVCRDWAPFDWCGNPDRGFYPDADTLSQSNLVERLVMCGLRGGPRRDFSWGNIHGIRRTWITTTSFEMSNAVSVGIFPGTIPPYPNHH